MGNFEPSKLFPPSCLFTSSKNPWLVWREIFQTPFYLFIGYEFSLLTKFQKDQRLIVMSSMTYLNFKFLW